MSSTSFLIFLDIGEFDFIIIGAGSAGCVIANRLSEIAKWKILLLEAGTYRDEDLSGIPALSIQDALTKYNWGFESVPQKYACLGTYIFDALWVSFKKGYLQVILNEGVTFQEAKVWEDHL